MFFAHRTRQRIRIAAVAMFMYALLAAGFAVLFPREGESFLSSFGWWTFAIPVGLGAYAALELFGTWSLERAFWQRMPSLVRILLLVAVIAFIACAVAVGAEYIGGGNAI